MKISMKRIAALVLTLVMVLGMLPVVNNAANAADVTGLSDSTIGLSANTAANWSASENKVDGFVVGQRVGTTSVYRAASDTLTITNNKKGTAKLSFDFELSGNFTTGTVTITNGDEVKTYDTAGTYSFSGELAAGKSITIAMSVIQSRTGTNQINIAITKLSLAAVGSDPITTTFEAPAFGSYTVAYGDVSLTVAAGTQSQTASNLPSVEYTLTAVPGDGYKFVGWYSVTADKYLSTKEEYSCYFDEASTVKAVIVPEDAAIFLVGSNYFSELNEAITYAQANSLTQITLVQSGTLAANDTGYTIPAGITLLIPKDTDYTVTGTDEMGIAPEYGIEVEVPYAYMTMTLAEGAKLTVNGTLDIESKHTTYQGGKTTGGRVCGPYGAIYMSPNSNITVNSGANLYAWGYVYGEGTVTANSGANIYEIMQVADFPGGTVMQEYVDLATDVDEDGDGNPTNDYIRTFPFSQYYVQNIEVALTLNKGASEYVYISMTAGGMSIGLPVKFIGENGMFNPASGSIVKEYDPSTDRLIVDVNGDASMAGIAIDLTGTKYEDGVKDVMGTSKFDSASFILTLNGNITININSGTTTIKQDLSLLPGVEISVAKDATLIIAQRVFADGEYDNLTVSGSGGYNVYVWDLENWGGYVFGSKKLIAVSYSPTSGRYTRTASDLKDVKIDINGKVICDGYIYSTVSVDQETWLPISGGAQIISTGKTGSIVMQSGAGWDFMAYCLDGTSKVNSAVDIDSVWLQNADGTFLNTTGAEAGATFGYCATHDCWYAEECGPCVAASTFEITWIGATGDLGTEEYDEGTVPSYKGTTPTKAADGCTVYTFAGWSTTPNGTALTALPAVTGEATYYAVFTESESHSWNAADCTTAKTCSVCGETEGSALGHSWNAADCTTAKTCSVCGETEGSALGHSWNAADCTTAKTCSVCGETEGSALGHSWNAADCTTAKTCSVCGETEGSALGHSWNAADCTTAKTCSVCGETDGAALGHSWNAADCTTAKTCSVCGETEGSALGHSWNAADCTTAKTCSVCGETEGSALGHSWNAADCTTAKTCSVCGETEGDALGHSWNAADCTTAKTCSVCGETEGDALGHSWNAADCTTAKTCSVCGETEGDALGHSWNAADCTTAKTCSVCGETEGAALGHSWNAADCTTAKTCSVCGETEGAALGHSWNAADCTTAKTCSVCGETEGSALGHGHTQGYEYTDLEDGNHSVTCKDCDTVTVASEAHTYTEGVCVCGVVKTYTLTLNLNGGTLSDETKEMLINAGFEVTDTEVVLKVPHGELGEADVFGVTKVGHTISGFVDQNGKTYEVGEEFVMTGDLTITTQWKANTYFLYVYDLDGSLLLYTQVPYGTSVYDYVKDLVGNPKRVETEDQIGYNVFTGWVDTSMNPIDEDYTMPAENLVVISEFAFTGWIKYGHIDGWVYEVKDQIQKTGWTEIDGSWYYLDPETGIRAEGVTRVPYPKNPINGITYAPNDEDIAYEGENFIDKDTGLFYFGEDGKFLSDYTDAVIDGEYCRYAVNGHIAWHVGLIENQGSYFYFIGDEVNGGNILATGDVYVGRNTTELDVTIGGIYTFNTDGSMMLWSGIVENNLFEGKRYYYQGQLMTGLGLSAAQKHNGTDWVTYYFYVNSYGSLIVDAEYYVGANDLGIAKGIYYFDADGFLVIPEPEPGKSGLYFEDGKWFYYVDGAKAYCAGLIEIDGNWVYVKSDGSLATGAYYVTNTNGHESISSGDKCLFDENGYLQEALNGVIDGYYYVDNTIAYAAGLVETENGYIYVKSNGQLVVGREYWITNVNNTGVVQGSYQFDENGLMLNPETEVKDGIVDGYYVNGKIAYAAGLIEIEPGKYIYVRSNGQVATGEYWTTNHNGVLEEGLYDFGEDGILVIE